LADVKMVNNVETEEPVKMKKKENRMGFTGIAIMGKSEETAEVMKHY